MGGKYNCHPGEPLDMLAEECAELIQAIMKHRRFGPSGAPGYTGTKPTEDIKREVGDVLCSIERLIESRFMSEDEALFARGQKRARLYELFGEHANPRRKSERPS